MIFPLNKDFQLRTIETFDEIYNLENEGKDSKE